MKKPIWETKRPPNLGSPKSFNKKNEHKMPNGKTMKGKKHNTKKK